MAAAVAVTGGATTTRRHALLRLLLAAPLLVVLAWGAGFAWFLGDIQRVPPPPPPHVDGVVALTGGAGRVGAAVHLLADGGAGKLLITGIGGNADLGAIAHLSGVDLTPLATRITLGRFAASTYGNAVETAAWATQNRIRSLIVVTAAWHMPRALVELRRALPDVALYPLPVGVEEVDAHAAQPSLRLRAEEYSKYLLVVAGLSSWFPHREAALSAGV
ncbi:MAG TPA: YdcF family protein [Rhodopila sp.]|nr:YdcF family protein [Rhodopila sp.]